MMTECSVLVLLNKLSAAFLKSSNILKKMHLKTLPFPHSSALWFDTVQINSGEISSFWFIFYFISQFLQISIGRAFFSATPWIDWKWESHLTFSQITAMIIHVSTYNQCTSYIMRTQWFEQFPKQNSKLKSSVTQRMEKVATISNHLCKMWMGGRLEKHFGVPQPPTRLNYNNGMKHSPSR